MTSKTQIKEKLLNIKYWVISQECFSLTPLSWAQKIVNQVTSSDEVLGSARALRLAFLPLLLTLGKMWLLQGGEINLILPFPTSMTVPRSFNRDLPSVICPFPTHSITR
jgi:hypothetical protein